MKKIALILTTIALTALACGLSISPENAEATVGAIATSVAATLEAGGNGPPDQPPEQPGTGTVEGAVCYPSEGIPPMTVYLQDTSSNAVVEVPIAQDQSAYSAQVSPGTYVAYAWLPSFSFGGSYSQAVPCGLGVNCTDHSLIEFHVTPGQPASGIDVCDWYGGPNDVPLPPNVDANSLVGSITGALGYPSEFIPPMTVVAFNQDTQQWFYVLTNENDQSYTIGQLPPGNYQVVAYPTIIDLPGGYTQAVICGLSANCTDHSLVTVQVVAGQTTQGVDPVDFYAGDGVFPANPVP